MIRLRPIARASLLATMSQMETEAATAASIYGDYSYNAQYVIVLPPNHFDQQSIAWSGCGQHSCTYVDGTRWIAYPAILYQPDNAFGQTSPCARGKNVNGFSTSLNDAVTIVAGHEFAEMVTDPGVAAWRDPVTGDEKGDRCYMVSANVTLGRGDVYPMQATWSNYDRYYHGGGCVFAGRVFRRNVLTDAAVS